MPSPTYFIIIDSIRVEFFISKYHCNVLFVQSMIGKYSEKEAGVSQVNYDNYASEWSLDWSIAFQM